jgi:Ca-activated chloride channel family protein
MPGLETLHFLRPAWLWAAIPLLAILVAAARQSPQVQWRRIIAPHLLEHLIVRPPGRFRMTPLMLFAVTSIICVVAVAGPTWHQEPSPFTEDRAPLVVALELTPRMLVADLQPSRLERAKQKIRDLAALRQGSRTGLVAWAGTAHLVVPLSDDPAAIGAFVADLDPGLMPIDGLEPTAALDRAAALLDRDGTPGTVLFVTAGIPERSLPELTAFSSERHDQIQVLAVATESGGLAPDGTRSALDRGALQAVADGAGAVVTLATVDASDVERVARRAQRHLEAAQREDNQGRWRDEGWWLVWPVALLTALWFRRGWSIRWEIG